MAGQRPAPFHALNVPTVDIASGKIIIDPPEVFFEQREMSLPNKATDANPLV